MIDEKQWNILNRVEELRKFSKLAKQRLKEKDRHTRKGNAPLVYLMYEYLCLTLLHAQSLDTQQYLPRVFR